jgi:hypothetical protein
MRASLYCSGSEASVILLVFDHLICDGWSFWQLIEELGDLLQAEALGKPVAAAPPPLEFFEHVTQQRGWLDSEQGRKQFEFWRSTLANPYAPLDLLPDRRPNSEHTHKGRDSVLSVLPEDLSDALHSLI